MSETRKPTMKVQANRDGSVRWAPLCAPPTPDLDAVVARVRSALARHDARVSGGTMRQTRCVVTADALDVDDVRTLLAAVSRPAEARGDDGPFFPDAEETARKLMYGDKVHVDDVKPMARALLDYSTRLRWLAVQRIESAHPAPSGGEGDKTLRDALVYAIERAVKSCAAQHDADVPPAAWIVDYAGILNAVQHKFPAAPRPEPGEPSEAMVTRIAAWVNTLPGLREPVFTDEVRDELRAALAAQRPTLAGGNGND